MSEAFEKLRNRILSDAKLKAEDIIREAEEKAAQKLEQARASARKEADEIVSRAEPEAEALRRSILSARIRANRLRLLEEKNRIVQQVMKSVEDKLSNVEPSDEFQDTLKRFVSEAVEAIGSDQSVVRIGYRNISKGQIDGIGKAVSKGTKIVVEDHPLEGLGGVIASDSDGKIVYNNSFKSRLDRLDSQLLTLVSSTIFG